ncbi:MAG: hypothetical protein KAS12_01340 [Candidatus Aenigmarchaeota archaeon]|nr:hypothetical protein [Candidatus Aenigmarchaeota archaeon]
MISPFKPLKTIWDVIDIVKWYSGMNIVKYKKSILVYHLISKYVCTWKEIHEFLKNYQLHHIPNIKKIIEGIYFTTSTAVTENVYDLNFIYSEDQRNEKCPELKKENYFIHESINPEEMLALYIELLIPIINEFEKNNQ